MTREIALFLVLAIGALALWAAWRGWQSKVAKFSHLPALPGVNSLRGATVASFPLMYIATTQVGSPLERIAMKPLAFRAKTRMSVHRDGLGLDITGEGQVAIPAAWVTGVGVATWTIDKVVDSEGLVFIRWSWGDEAVESYFRPVDSARDDVIRAIESMLSDEGESTS